MSCLGLSITPSFRSPKSHLWARTCRLQARVYHCSRRRSPMALYTIRSMPWTASSVNRGGKVWAVPPGTPKPQPHSRAHFFGRGTDAVDPFDLTPEQADQWQADYEAAQAAQMHDMHVQGLQHAREIEARSATGNWDPAVSAAHGVGGNTAQPQADVMPQYSLQVPAGGSPVQPPAAASRGSWMSGVLLAVAIAAVAGLANGRRSQFAQGFARFQELFRSAQGHLLLKDAQKLASKLGDADAATLESAADPSLRAYMQRQRAQGVDVAEQSVAVQPVTQEVRLPDFDPKDVPDRKAAYQAIFARKREWEDKRKERIKGRGSSFSSLSVDRAGDTQMPQAQEDSPALDDQHDASLDRLSREGGTQPALKEESEAASSGEAQGLNTVGAGADLLSAMRKHSADRGPGTRVLGSPPDAASHRDASSAGNGASRSSRSVRGGAVGSGALGGPGYSGGRSTTRALATGGRVPAALLADNPVPASAAAIGDVSHPDAGDAVAAVHSAVPLQRSYSNDVSVPHFAGSSGSVGGAGRQGLTDVEGIDGTPEDASVSVDSSGIADSGRGGVASTTGRGGDVVVRPGISELEGDGTAIEGRNLSWDETRARVGTGAEGAHSAWDAEVERGGTGVEGADSAWDVEVEGGGMPEQYLDAVERARTSIKEALAQDASDSTQQPEHDIDALISDHLTSRLRARMRVSAGLPTWMRERLSVVLLTAPAADMQDSLRQVTLIKAPVDSRMVNTLLVCKSKEVATSVRRSFPKGQLSQAVPIMVTMEMLLAWLAEVTQQDASAAGLAVAYVDQPVQIRSLPTVVDIEGEYADLLAACELLEPKLLSRILAAYTNLVAVEMERTGADIAQMNAQAMRQYFEASAAQTDSQTDITAESAFLVNDPFTRAFVPLEEGFRATPAQAMNILTDLSAADELQQAQAQAQEQQAQQERIERLCIDSNMVWKDYLFRLLGNAGFDLEQQEQQQDGPTAAVDRKAAESPVQLDEEVYADAMRMALEMADLSATSTTSRAGRGVQLREESYLQPQPEQQEQQSVTSDFGSAGGTAASKHGNSSSGSCSSSISSSNGMDVGVKSSDTPASTIDDESSFLSAAAGAAMRYLFSNETDSGDADGANGEQQEGSQVQQLDGFIDPALLNRDEVVEEEEGNEGEQDDGPLDDEPLSRTQNSDGSTTLTYEDDISVVVPAGHALAMPTGAGAYTGPATQGASSDVLRDLLDPPTNTLGPLRLNTAWWSLSPALYIPMFHLYDGAAVGMSINLDVGDEYDINFDDDEDSNDDDDARPGDQDEGRDAARMSGSMTQNRHLILACEDPDDAWELLLSPVAHECYEDGGQPVCNPSVVDMSPDELTDIAQDMECAGVYVFPQGKVPPEAQEDYYAFHKAVLRMISEQC